MCRITPITYRLAGGISVLAKLEQNETVPCHFANRTQADRRANELQAQNIDAATIQRGRPFYVRINPAPATANQEAQP